MSPSPQKSIPYWHVLQQKLQNWYGGLQRGETLSLAGPALLGEDIRSWRLSRQTARWTSSYCNTRRMPDKEAESPAWVIRCRNIVTVGNELRSQFEKTHGPCGHGPQGLTQSIEQCLEVITEIRLQTDYGDYLAVSLGNSTTNEYSDMMWKAPAQKDWQEATNLLEKEEKELRQYEWKSVRLTLRCGFTTVNRMA